MVEDSFFKVNVAAEGDDLEALEVGSCSQKLHFLLEGVDDWDGAKPVD